MEKNKQINFRVSQSTKDRIKDLANKKGYKNISEYIVSLALGQEERKEQEKTFYTLTFSPAIDFHLQQDEDGTFRQEKSWFKAGGKGINASLILDELGYHTRAIHISGGFTGDFLKEYLWKKSISNTQIKTQNPTRINLFINKNDSYERHIIKPLPIEPQTKNRLLSEISFIKNDSNIILGGYVAEQDEKFIENIIKEISEKNSKIFFTFKSSLIIKFAKYKPEVALFNDQLLVKDKIIKDNNDKTIWEFLETVTKKGIKNSLVIKDNRYLFIISEENKKYTCDIGERKTHFSRGTNDAFLATFGVKRNLGLEKAFKWASSAAVAKSLIEGTPKLSDIEKVHKSIVIKEVEND